MTGPLFSDAQLLPGGPAFVTEAGGDALAALWRSDDLGRTFRPLLDRRLLGGSVKLYGTWFLDERHGFVCGEDADGDGTLLVTEDGGLSWEPVHDLADQAFAVPLTQVVFADERRGLVTGAGEALWRTVDGGRSWRAVAVPDLAAFGVFFLDGTGQGWVLSQELTEELRILRTQHFRTRDGGGTFEALGDALDGTPLCVDVSACAFWDERTGVLCGPDGLLLRTTDGARTWTRLPPLVASDLNFLVPLDFGVAYALGCAGVVLRTTDAGLSWVRLATGVEVELHAAAFADRERGFVVGEGGVALWTEDGGRSWAESRVER